MKCVNCGKELEDGVAVCPDCATEVAADQKDVTAESETVVTEESEEIEKPEEIEEPEEIVTPVEKYKAAGDAGKGSKDVLALLKKNIKLVIGGVAALIALIVIICIVIGNRSNYTFVDYSSGYFMQCSTEELTNMDGLRVDAEEDFYSLSYSPDKSLTVMTAYDNPYYIVTEDGVTYYIVTEDGVEEIDENISYLVISNYGDTIAYVKDAENQIGELYLYTVSKQESVMIDEEVYAGKIVLSPNGKTVAYIGGCEVEDEWYNSPVNGSVYVSKNSKEGEKCYRDSVPVAVSDGGKYLYYIKDNEKLYMNDERISSSFEMPLYFNEKYTELVFNEDADAQYFSAKSKEVVQLKNNRFLGLYLPANAFQKEQYMMEYCVVTYGVQTFEETVMNVVGTAYYMSNNGEEMEKISSGIQSMKVSEDGNGLLYLDSDDNLYYVKNVKKSVDAEKVADDLEIETFYASSDLKKIYFVSDDELYYLKKGKGVRIADVDSCVYSDEYKGVYFVDEEELYFATTKAKTKKMVMGEKVEWLLAYGDNILFRHENEDEESDMYIITGKTKCEIFDER